MTRGREKIKKKRGCNVICPHSEAQQGIIPVILSPFHTHSRTSSAPQFWHLSKQNRSQVVIYMGELFPPLLSLQEFNYCSSIMNKQDYFQGKLAEKKRKYNKHRILPKSLPLFFFFFLMCMNYSSFPSLCSTAAETSDQQFPFNLAKGTEMIWVLRVGLHPPGPHQHLPWGWSCCRWTRLGNSWACSGPGAGLDDPHGPFHLRISTIPSSQTVLVPTPFKTLIKAQDFLILSCSALSCSQCRALLPWSQC